MNGYIQIDLNGKSVGLKYTTYTFEILGKRLIDKGVDPNSLSGLLETIYAGYLGNCFVKDVRPEISYEEFADWMEDVAMDESKHGVIKEISNVIEQSKAYKATLPVKESEDEKKTK